MINFFKKHNKVIALLTVVATFGLTRVALAATCANGDIVLQVPIPGLGWCVKGFPEYLQAIYNLFVGISGILAVIMMMYGGFQWLIAGGNPTKISGAKATILSAMAGLTLLLASYAILNLINPNLTNLSLDPEKLTGQEYSGELGYCRKSFVLGNGDMPICGKTFNIKDVKGATCIGSYCQASAAPGISPGSINVRVCFVDHCEQEINLPGLINYGYDGRVIASASSSLTCGELVHLGGTSESLKHLVLGTYCWNDGYCAMASMDYSISKKFKEVDNGLAKTTVGQFTNAGCY